MTVTHRLRNLDLNLLVALDVVLRTKSVSIAASEMGVSQPAMSKTVGRLRRYFDDELLVRRGRHYELTSAARHLQIGVAEALGTIDRAITTRTELDVDQSFEISIIASELLAAVMAPAISRSMHAEAPRSVLKVLNPTFERGTAGSLESLAAGTADGIILPHGWLSGLEHIDLMDDDWVFAVADDDPATHLDVSDLRLRPWVVMRLPNGEMTRGMQQVVTAGVQPLIEVEASPTMAIPMFLAGTNRVAVVGKSLVALFGPLLGIKELPGPFPLGNHRHAFWWHASRREDPVHRWLRGAVVDASLMIEQHGADRS